MTDDIQPDWTRAPGWAKYWAADSNGDAYWYKDEPTYQHFSPDAYYSAGYWEHAGGYDRHIWGVTVMWDSSWPPEGFELRDTIAWDNTLRVRP